MFKKIRQSIYTEIESIFPLDKQESEDIQKCLEWVNSGVELCRIEKPANPPKHLISYFVVVDGDNVLLVDHINAKLWLPTGGHVEPGEHPRKTVEREVEEELGIKAKFLIKKPLFITVTETVGLTAGHTDVSIWYVLSSSIHTQFKYDKSEFNSVKWFGVSDVPFDRSDPNMGRFLEKLKAISI